MFRCHNARSIGSRIALTRSIGEGCFVFRGLLGLRLSRLTPWNEEESLSQKKTIPRWGRHLSQAKRSKWIRCLRLESKRHTIYTPSTPSNRRAFLLDCRDDSKPRGPWGGSDEAVQRSSGWCLISKQADYARTSSVGITVNPGDLFSPEWGRSC